jgi:hypothetical protein
MQNEKKAFNFRKMWNKRQQKHFVPWLNKAEQDQKQFLS